MPSQEAKPQEPVKVPVPVNEWAAAGVAAMLARVRSVCITEYQWLIEDLRSGR
jgi:hypothetical protein